MKIQELRIGNFIKSDFYKKEIEIHSICDVTGDIYNRTTGEIPITNIHPIKINEDILKRLPFVFDDMEDTNEDNTWYWLKYGNYLKFNSDKSCEFKAIFITINGFTFKIEYLHDFQNLYYSLTGQDVVFSAVS
ncbi:TPA: hypothetical protein ACT5CK_002464 [Flavobacterium psychrophilum]|uniref:hypothetical protein n=1 Tax=Flavobacterium psychrophilum TaxID=96345 RepID=UPI00073F7B6A|nr:hypothetical protein [Flavobacterium psychrophilum]GAQ50192.1 hypothetical protein FPK15_contig00141-0001 [Flavobacterium psychrophilum]GAW90822.1 hypothetical protein FPS14_contig00139-0001 [Flavobacterium psychrophilum]GEJ35392.1 hypothetical protein FPN185_contig00135-0001 [Flavobacterium psychrophilum]GEJ38236.1 hypothetical protein FPN184_contig00071-0002 [Flavobacterium psychrophilum]GEJ41431.1 hypothetical protein FPN187_contig00123-0001 [Flavobacterium psychrophilum]